MKVCLYDTYAREKREFIPINSGQVGLYCCGPTVYNYAHIGNLRTYIFEDLLRRTLEMNGFEVRHVVNITDVGHLVSDADDGEDKMEAGSARTGKSAWEIAELYTDAFESDLRQLNILPPTVWCKATDHIAEQITDIKKIYDKGLAYVTSDGVYFDTAKQPNYGYLARLDKDGLQGGSRVDLGEKRQATDFALWKFSPAGKQRQMEWDSPWGKGFPGWHIECSAMAARFLSPLFDIHCGGKDHISVHHCNEIAQAEACYDTRLANYWLHGYFLEVDKAKMSKSSGEFLRLQTLLDKGIDPLTYRYLCLSAHYRSDMTFSWESLDAASVALNRLRQQYISWDANYAEPDKNLVQRFMACINDDLNTSKAMAVVWDLAKSDLPSKTKRATTRYFDKVLGLGLEAWQPAVNEIPPDIQELADKREEARLEKDWASADKARDALLERGYEILDTQDGPVVKHRT